MDNTPEVASTEVSETPVDAKALQAEIDRLKGENDKLKKATTAASADASRYKKELASRMSEDERKSTEAAEATRKLQEELEMLRRDKAVSEHKAQFLSLGFGEDLATSSAAAIADGDTNSLFGALKEFIAGKDKAIASATLLSTPSPVSGGAPAAVTKEQFDKMTYKELVDLHKNNPDLYAELSKN